MMISSETYEKHGWLEEYNFSLLGTPIVPGSLVASIYIEHWPDGFGVSEFAKTLLSQRPDWTFFQEHDLFDEVSLNYLTGLLYIKLNPKVVASCFTIHVSYEHECRGVTPKVCPRCIDDPWES